MPKKHLSRRDALIIICKEWLFLHDLNDEFSSDRIVDSILSTYQIMVGDFREILEEDHFADVYKVTSGIQLSTIYKQPIQLSDPIKSNKLNILLAFFIGFSFLSQQKKINLQPHKYSRNEVVSNIAMKHLEFLIRTYEKQPIELPVISNALFWEAFVELFQNTTLNSESDSDQDS